MAEHRKHLCSRERTHHSWEPELDSEKAHATPDRLSVTAEVEPSTTSNRGAPNDVSCDRSCLRNQIKTEPNAKKIAARKRQAVAVASCDSNLPASNGIALQIATTAPSR